MTTAVRVLLWALVGVSFGLATQLLLRISTATWQLHVPKAAAQALSSYLVVAGLLGSGLAVVLPLRGASATMGVAVAVGVAAALLAGWHLEQVRAPDDAVAAAFGPGWFEGIPADQTAVMLPARWRWALPSGPTPRTERDVVYAKVPGTDRELLADVWQPPHDVASSGLGYVYVPGGYYQLGGKTSAPVRCSAT